MNKITALVLLAMAGSPAWAEEISNATAGIVTPDAAVFTDFTDFALFQGAFGAPLTRIGFDEVPEATTVTTQYQNDGAVFTDADDITLADANFTEDGIGLKGNGRIHIEFTQPVIAIGAYFPGAMTIEVFDSQGDVPLYQSADFGGGGSGNFGGVISDTGFGFVEIRDWVDDAVFIDDLVFGFAPADNGVAGCIKLNGTPLTFNVIALLQPDEPYKLAQTDEGGCYVFEAPVPGKRFNLFIFGDRVPPEQMP